MCIIATDWFIGGWLESCLMYSRNLCNFAPRFSLDLYKDRFVDSINKENTGISLFFSFKQNRISSEAFLLIYIYRMKEIVEIRDLATVITNLLSAIPWIGTDLVEFSHLLLISLFILAILPTIGTVRSKVLRGALPRTENDKRYALNIP
jgi:hypothetical protein